MVAWAQAVATDSFTVVTNHGHVMAHNRADCPALKHAPNRTRHANFDSLAVALLMSDGRPRPCGHCWPETMKPAGFRHWVANLALAAGRALADRGTEGVNPEINLLLELGERRQDAQQEAACRRSCVDLHPPPGQRSTRGLALRAGQVLHGGLCSLHYILPCSQARGIA